MDKLMIDRITNAYYNAKFRLRCWWLWWSPPWRRTRLCPGCAGSKTICNSYDDRPCDVCNGMGRIRKYKL
jgi:hypothetical protein